MDMDDAKGKEGYAQLVPETPLRKAPDGSGPCDDRVSLPQRSTRSIYDCQ